MKIPEHVIIVILVSLLLTLNIFTSFSIVSVVDIEQVHVCWVMSDKSVKQ